jgi:hypothetical protein
MRPILTFEFLQNNNNVRSDFTPLKNKRDGFKSSKNVAGLLRGRGMVSGFFEKKQDVIPPHLAQPQAPVRNINAPREECDCGHSEI